MKIKPLVDVVKCKLIKLLHFKTAFSCKLTKSQLIGFIN